MEDKEGEQPMIAFDFEYYKPSSMAEAIETFNMFREQGKNVMYFSGGTEIITFARVNKLTCRCGY